MATQAERREGTKRALVEAATTRFAVDGYEHASTESIRREAGVSRGALYHHFPSKRDLFEAVFEEVSTATIERAIRSTGSAGSPLADLTETCLAWLREVQDHQTATILIELGPRVLGWEQARDLEATTSLGLVETALDRASAAGEIAVASVPITAKLLNAVLAEAALAAVNSLSADFMVELERAVRQFIAGLASTSGT